VKLSSPHKAWKRIGCFSITIDPGKMERPLSAPFTCALGRKRKSQKENIWEPVFNHAAGDLVYICGRSIGHLSRPADLVSCSILDARDRKSSIRFWYHAGQQSMLEWRVSRPVTRKCHAEIAGPASLLLFPIGERYFRSCTSRLRNSRRATAVFESILRMSALTIRPSYSL